MARKKKTATANDDGKVEISIRLDDSTTQFVDLVAALGGESTSTVINVFLAAYVARDRMFATAKARELYEAHEACGEAYQVIGAAMLGSDPVAYTQADVNRILDNLAAVVRGDDRPHRDLLPWPKPKQTKRPRIPPEATQDAPRRSTKKAKR